MLIVNVIKLGATIFVTFAVCGVFWFYLSRKESTAISENDSEQPIFILEGENIVEVLKPSTTRFPEQNGAFVNQTPAANKAERIDQGRKIYQKICIACHQPNGQGVSAIFPPLANSDFLNSDKKRAISIVVNGLNEEILVNGKKFHNLMPKPGLNDEEIANVLTFVYSQWENNGAEVTPDEVTAIRKRGVKAQVK